MNIGTSNFDNARYVPNANPIAPGATYTPEKVAFFWGNDNTRFPPPTWNIALPRLMIVTAVNALSLKKDANATNKSPVNVIFLGDTYKSDNSPNGACNAKANPLYSSIPNRAWYPKSKTPTTKNTQAASTVKCAIEYMNKKIIRFCFFIF